MTSRNPVLLIHGINDTGALFKRMAAYLQGNGWQVHRLSLTPNNGDAGLDELAEQIASYVQANFVDDQALDLVGFSMGGLVSRYYLQRLGGIERVRRLITISAPHHGTWTAFLLGNPGARQMRPGSPFLRDLNRDAMMLDRLQVTSIWTPLDLTIVPAKSSVLQTGRTIRVHVAAHPWMVRDRRVLRLVLQALTDGQ